MSNFYKTKRLNGANKFQTIIPLTHAYMMLQKESTLVFSSGQLKPGIDKEVPNKQKKWLLAGANAQPGHAQFIPER